MGMIKSRKILIVEDNPVVSKVLERYTQTKLDCGLTVHLASDGLKGYEMAVAQKPDLILLDLNMPIYNGKWFLETSKIDPLLADTPVIVYSAADDNAVKLIQKEFPAVKAALKKPVTPSHLVKVIQQYLSI